MGIFVFLFFPFYFRSIISFVYSSFLQFFPFLLPFIIFPLILLSLSLCNLVLKRLTNYFKSYWNSNLESREYPAGMLWIEYRTDVISCLARSSKCHKSTYAHICVPDPFLSLLPQTLFDRHQCMVGVPLTNILVWCEAWQQQRRKKEKTVLNTIGSAKLSNMSTVCWKSHFVYIHVNVADVFIRHLWLTPGPVWAFFFIVQIL